MTIRLHCTVSTLVNGVLDLFLHALLPTSLLACFLWLIQRGLVVWTPEERKVLVLPPGETASVCKALAP